MKLFCLSTSIAICFYWFSASAQTPVGIDAQNNINTLAGGDINSLIRKFDNRYQGVMGSPFLSDQWNSGTVTLNNGKVLSNMPLKIDLYANEVIAKRQSGDSIIIFANSIQKVSFTDARTGANFRFEKISALTGEKPPSKEGYLDVLYQGKYALLAERKKTLIKANYTGGYSAGKPYDEFVDETTYYIKKPDQKPEKIRLTKKTLIDQFPDHQKELKDFVSTNQIDLRNEAQAIQIFEYYHSLK